MALLKGKGPITVQVSPSTYGLIMKLAELCVQYAPSSENLQFRQDVVGRLAQLYSDLIADYNKNNPGAPTPTTLANLLTLQTDGLTEAQDINKNAGSEIVMAC